MASNVLAKLDVKDNIYPNKERPENKIDGIVALIMSLSRAIANVIPEETLSDHITKHGLRTL
jgi:phage terminase large subunit-like protein